MITRYETENSVYEVDLDGKRYRRFPIFQAEVFSERLLYGEWLPLKDVEHPVTLLDDMRLHILHETSTYGIVTSQVKAVWDVEEVGE